MSTSILMDPRQIAREDEARKAVEAQKQKDNLEAEVADTNTKIPEKFKGKTFVDVVDSYTNLEKELSRTKNELAEKNKVVDQLVQLEPKVTKQEEQAKVTSDDLFEDPEKAISQVIENNPVIKQAKNQADIIERSMQVNEFASRHPTYKDDLANPEFVEFIKAKPNRLELAQKADSYDLQAADMLWDLWNDYKSIHADAKNTRKFEKQEELERQEADGTLESGSGTVVESKKILSRAEIIDLKKRAAQGDRRAQVIVEDPVWRAEVNRAYMEKRVQ